MDFEFENLMDCIQQLPICAKYGKVPSNSGYTDNEIYYGDMFIVSLETNYNGDGIVIGFKFQDTDYENLQMANYEKSYNKLIKHINKSYSLRVATSGYTACTIPVGEF